MEVVLPLKTYDINKVIKLVNWIQRKNYAAYLSHRRKKFRLLIN